MMADSCETCKFVGYFPLEPSGQAHRSRTSFHGNFGGNDYRSTDEETKDELLKRHYPNILALKDMSEQEFTVGCVGFNVCPEVPYISTIPKIVDFEAADKKYKDRDTRLDNEVRKIIATDTAEKAIIDGFQDYFKNDHPHEDIFLLFRQNIYCQYEGYERDAIVVNLTKGYILNMEAKATLRKNVLCCVCGNFFNFCNLRVHLLFDHFPAEFRTHENTCICKKTIKHGCNYCDKLIHSVEMGKSLEKQAKDGLQQLQKTLEILNDNFKGNLEKKWSIITLLYGSRIHYDFPRCTNCEKYVFKKGDDFQKKLRNILSNEPTKDASYSQDFYFLVKELLPMKIKIAKTLTDTFKMKSELLAISSKNIEAAGKAENVAFWSPAQVNIALQCLSMNRVLFKSGWSTGKTILMMDCAKKLLNKYEKVLFVINDHYGTINLVKDKSKINNLPLLLQMKLEGYFKDNAELIKIVSESLDIEELPNLVEKYKDHNIFVDEMRFTKSLDKFDEAAYSNLKKVSDTIQDKHFWIAITIYEGKDVVFDMKRVNFFNHFPLRLSLRNSYQITKKVLEHESAKPYSWHDSVMGQSDEEYTNELLEYEEEQKLYRDYQRNPGLYEDFPVTDPDDRDPKEFEKEQDEKSNNYKNLVGTQPSNQTNSFDVPTINANDYEHGIQVAISNLRKISEDIRALFVIDTHDLTGSIPMWCIAKDNPGCLADKNHKEALKSLLIETFQGNGRGQPAIYMDEDGIEDARQWVDSDIKSRDLICEYALIQGFEHDAVVVFQDQNPEKFEHNSCMRAKSILIIVELPEHQKRFCFGKCAHR